MRLRTKTLFSVLNRNYARLLSMEVGEARQYFDKSTANRFKPKVRNLREELIGPQGAIRIRIYSEGDNTQPTIVFFHGGGFVVGSLDSHDGVARLICKASKCTVVSVDYRLAPEHPFPAASEDGVTVLSWLQAQSRLNNEQVFLAGDSSGGQAALYTYLLANKELQTSVRGIVLIYPALDPRLQTKSMQDFAEKHFVTKAGMRLFWDAYLDGQVLQWPLPKGQLKQLPPLLIQTADYDILRDEGYDLTQAIDKVGGTSEYHCYKNTSHGFMQLPVILGGRSAALKDMANFVARASKAS